MVGRFLHWMLVGLVVVHSVRGQGPTAAGGNGLKGEYYRGRAFNRKIFTRMDPRIDFDWRGKTPGPGMSPSFYSIRWTGKLYAPVSGEYRFTATVDDGIRLWVGGKMVLDDWRLNDSKTLMGTITLKAGEYYDLRVDYFNDILEGQIKLYWITPKDNPASRGKLITGDVFFNPGYQPPKPVVEELPKPVAVKKPVLVEKPKPRPVVSGETRVPKPKDSVAVAKVIPKPVTETAPKLEVSTRITPAPSAAPSITDLPVAPASGTAIELSPILFEQSDYRLLPQSYSELDKLVRMMNQHPTLQLQIIGHTDNVGDARLNLALSENRAKVIATYLIRNGIKADRLDARGYGGTHPIADNTTETERAKNRRVEFTVK